MKKKLVIVADDFTGANDTGVQFRKAGLKVNVIINTHQLIEDFEHTDVLVIDIESRFVTQEDAYQKCYNLGKQLCALGDIIVYKKLDSTLRGNIGAEIDGLMDGLQLKVTLLAPGWPLNGRTTHNGEVYLHGVKLEHTEVANDPRTPVKISRIAEIIHLQSARKCSEVSTVFFEEDPFETNEFIRKEIESGTEIIIFDAVEEKDLESIARLIEHSENISMLIAGSAGLADHLRELSFVHPNRLSFVFSGSVSERTSSQIRYAIDHDNCRLVFIHGEDLLNEDLKSEQLIADVWEGIQKGERQFIFTSAISPDDTEKVFFEAQKRSLSKDEVAERVALGIGKLAAILIERFHPSGVLLTGGDIAIKTVLALNATGINIDREIFPGIPSGLLTGCPIRSIIATKSGSFGADDAILKTLEFFSSTT